ncbi:cystathionine gamma-synthase [Kineococcus xinjiangensis]|uniref:homocysteine desulfhydrase n=1 Tax=Kineococcus xinjiangensis TaxID=512762 RepID=A0A2S6IW88_9ACTN|nr:PLP-dependent aspartate aminotransferase family protein [Kineococcus xinjiangensis]PPK98555.1 cystathionine gamma-synthase [Kineococcus xinjiangensis]
MPDAQPEPQSVPQPPAGAGAALAAASSAALSPATLAVVAGRPPRTPDAEVNVGVSLTSTYVGSASTGAGGRGYGRFGNPTWEAFEEALGALEGGSALTFASGMGAVSAVLGLLPAGASLLVPHGAYNGTHALAGLLRQRGVLGDVVGVDITDPGDVREALAAAGAGALLWLESPTNPLLEVADLRALTELGHAAGALVAVDNTFATPLLQRPLDLGADVVVHSVTKFLAGHSDVVLGAVVVRDAELRTRLLQQRTLHGAIPGPLEVFLALRGLRTLHLRLERSQASAAELARRLAGHRAVRRVRHPSLPSDPGHELAARQMGGFGAIVSVEVAGGAAAADAVVDAVRLWLPATSLGGVESLIERRRRHPSEPAVVPEDLLRLSVGVEDVEDLWRDLDAALSSAL